VILPPRVIRGSRSGQRRGRNRERCENDELPQSNPPSGTDQPPGRPGAAQGAPATPPCQAAGPAAARGCRPSLCAPTPALVGLADCRGDLPVGVEWREPPDEPPEIDPAAAAIEPLRKARSLRNSGRLQRLARLGGNPRRHPSAAARGRQPNPFPRRLGQAQERGASSLRRRRRSTLWSTC
jgi:hypothetical protein